MPARPKEYELSVEQELPAAADGAPRRTRLTARFPRAPGDGEIEDAELALLLRELVDRLARATEAAAVGRNAAPENRPARPLSELLETYRPRQIELVELLHADGELAEREYEMLRAHMTEHVAPPTATVPPTEASPPAARTGARPVEELLRTYQITSLRQAGAVRARRQISFDEYMALKRHFAAAEAPAPESGAPS